MRMLSPFIIMMLALAAFAGDAHGEGFSKLRSLNDPAYHLLESEILERALHLYVRLPDDYDPSGDPYPAVYLLDGEVTFPMLAAYERYLSLGRDTPDVIIVGVTYGAQTFDEGNMRGTDYTAPSDERDFWGGAPKFQDVLEDEALPIIEGAYNADPNRRILFGQSLGGQFVLYTALTKPDLFWGHIASNPALHRNLAFFLDFEFTGEEATSSRLYAVSGADDDPVFREPALRWFSHWNDAPIKPWALKTESLDGHTHFSIGPAAYRNGMKWLFAEP